MSWRSHKKQQRPPIVVLFIFVIAAVKAHARLARVRNGDNVCTSKRLQPGELLQFYCPTNVTAGDPAAIYFNGSQILASERYWLKGSFLRFIVDERDAGIYECRSKSQQTGHCLMLTVMDEFRLPEIIVNAHRHDVLEGRNLTLVCNALRAVFIVWYKDEQIIENDPHYQTTSGISSPDSNLVVTRVTSDDGGNYRCEAYNAWGKASATFNVNINEVLYKKRWFHLIFDFRAEDPCSVEQEEDYTTGPTSPREIIRQTLPALCPECTKFADLRQYVLASRNSMPCSDGAYIVRVYVFVDGGGTNLDLWKLYKTFGLRAWQGDFILPQSELSALRWRVTTFCAKERPELEHNSICYKSRLRYIYRPTVGQTSAGDLVIPQRSHTPRKQIETASTDSYISSMPTTAQNGSPLDEKLQMQSASGKLHNNFSAIAIFLAAVTSMIIHHY